VPFNAPSSTSKILHLVSWNTSEELVLTQLQREGLWILELYAKMKLMKNWILHHAAAFSAYSSALIAFWIYSRTLAPGLTWAHHGADGGDLAAALLTGGVPHPPGAPLYLALGEIFLQLPFANPALALNALSAVCAAGAAGLIAHTVARQAPERLAIPAGWIAGLSLAFSPLLWSQAVITELYAPAAFFSALIIHLATRRAHSKFSNFYLGLAQGAGVAIHPSLILLLPLSIWPICRSTRQRKVILQFLLGLLIGCLPYASLPLRAINDSAVNWGRAANLRGWWWLVSGKLYHGYLFSLPISHFPARLSAWPGLIITQFTALGAVVAVEGFRKIWQHERALVLAMGASIIGLSVVAIGYDTIDSFYWLIPALVILSYALGLGFSSIGVHIQSHKARIAVEILIILLLLGWQLITQWDAMDASRDLRAQDFVEHVLQEAPQEALLITQQDQHTFALWYAIYGMNHRTDLHVVDQDLWTFDWYRDGVRLQLGEEFDLEALEQFAYTPTCFVESEGTLACK
jgi:hypothetical protein